MIYVEYLFFFCESGILLLVRQRVPYVMNPLYRPFSPEVLMSCPGRKFYLFKQLVAGGIEHAHAIMLCVLGDSWKLASGFIQPSPMYLLQILLCILLL